MPQTTHGDLHVSLFHIEHSSYHTLQLVDHTHPYWALSYVASGCVKTLCRGNSFQVHPGDIMIHPPAIAYSELATVPGTHEWLLLEATLTPSIDLLRQFPISPVVRLSSPETFSTIFNSLHTSWHSEHTTTRWLHTLALTTQLLSLVISSWESTGSVPRPTTMLSTEDRFTQVINYMADHLADHLSRQQLAAMMSLHPVYFDRLFRQAYTMPPMRMLREMRLQRAKEYLESTDATLETIASSCGLGSGSSFVRIFQQRFAQTPGDYRQGLKKARSRYVPFL